MWDTNALYKKNTLFLTHTLKQLKPFNFRSTFLHPSLLSSSWKKLFMSLSCIHDNSFTFFFYFTFLFPSSKRGNVQYCQCQVPHLLVQTWLSATPKTMTSQKRPPHNVNTHVFARLSSKKTLIKLELMHNELNATQPIFFFPFSMTWRSIFNALLQWKNAFCHHLKLNSFVTALPLS